MNYQRTCKKLSHFISIFSDAYVFVQTNYDDGEEIGGVDCGHEYHSECIKKWLVTKNSCPVCKSTALNYRARGICE